MTPLTPREKQVLKLIAEGKQDKEIAQILGISYRTVEPYKAGLRQKLGIHSVALLTRYAIEEGVV